MQTDHDAGGGVESGQVLEGTPPLPESCDWHRLALVGGEYVCPLCGEPLQFPALDERELLQPAALGA